MSSSIFDELVDRRGTDSMKWDGLDRFYGNPKAIPFWVADMDFPCPEPILKALSDRLQHPVLGYTLRGAGYQNAVLQWLRERHSWDVDPQCLLFCPPGVTLGMEIMLKLATKEGEGVLVQRPLYDPLLDIIAENGRTIVNSPLVLMNKRYEMDFEDLERKAQEKDVCAMILCSPHNPTGRVWTEEELRRLGGICHRHGVTILSDEIHADLTYPGHRHIPFGSLGEEFLAMSVCCFSASKTFNLGGLQLATLVTGHKELRDRFAKILGTSQIRLDNLFGAVALEAGYCHCGDWVGELMEYVQGNLGCLRDFLQNRLPLVSLLEPEGTYLVWLDFRSSGIPLDDLAGELARKAGVALCDGAEFGPEGKGFLRMNIACPRSVLLRGLERLEKGIALLN